METLLNVLALAFISWYAARQASVMDDIRIKPIYPSLIWTMNSLALNVLMVVAGLAALITALLA